MLGPCGARGKWSRDVARKAFDAATRLEANFVMTRYPIATTLRGNLVLNLDLLVTCALLVAGMAIVGCSRRPDPSGHPDRTGPEGQSERIAAVIVRDSAQSEAPTAIAAGNIIPNAARKPDESTWPPIRLGTWDTTSERVLPSGKVQRWMGQTKVCRHPRSLFFGYWGVKEVQRGGCSWRSTMISENRFNISATCDVRGGGKTESTLILENENQFSMEVTIKEGRRSYRGSESGRRVGDCPPETEAGER